MSKRKATSDDEKNSADEAADEHWRSVARLAHDNRGARRSLRLFLRGHPRLQHHVPEDDGRAEPLRNTQGHGGRLAYGAGSHEMNPENPRTSSGGRRVYGHHGGHAGGRAVRQPGAPVPHVQPNIPGGAAPGVRQYRRELLRSSLAGRQQPLHYTLMREGGDHLPEGVAAIHDRYAYSADQNAAFAEITADETRQGMRERAEQAMAAFNREVAIPARRHFSPRHHVVEPYSGPEDSPSGSEPSEGSGMSHSTDRFGGPVRSAKFSGKGKGPARR